VTAVAPAPAAWWDDLGDDELLRRLVQRGVRWEAARRLVRDRDREPVARQAISRTLRR